LISLLGQLALQCSGCEFSQITVESNNDGGKPFILDLNSPNGESAGSLYVPSGLSGRENTTLAITFTTNVPENFSNQRLGGIILDITLTDPEGQLITQLDTPLVICLLQPNSSKINKSKAPCLSYYDEGNSKWRCEDECLSNPGNHSLLCGRTDHLTNFALLLSGSSTEGDPCVSQSNDNTLAWVSLGLVAGAILIVALSGIAIEIRTRLHSRKLETQIARMAAV
jgi:hypothetical protein